MVVIILEVKLMRNDVKNFVEAIEFLSGRVLQSDGCITSEVYFTKKESASVVMVDEWQSMEKYKDYLKSESYKQVLSLLEYAMHKPSAKIYTTESMKNFSWIENILQTNISEAILETPIY